MSVVSWHASSMGFSPALAAPGRAFRTPQYVQYYGNLNARQERRLLAENLQPICAP